MKNRVIILLNAMVIISLLLSGCSDKVKPGSAEVKRPIISGVTMQEVQLATVDEYNETAGTIRANNVSIIGSKVMGTVTNVLVKEGDRVRAGQLLLTLDNRDVAARVTAAQAGQLEAEQALDMTKQNQLLASTTYERYRQLYQESAISQQQMDQVATQEKVAVADFQRVQESVKRAQATVVEAQANYDFTQIIAPGNGIVTAKKIDSGSMALPGVTLFVIDDDSSYIVEADVDESIAGKVMLGMTTEIRVDSIGKSLVGIVTELAPRIDSTTRKLHIKIDVNGEGLKSGLYAQVRIPTNKKSTILVTKTAIVEKGQLTGVYVVDENGVVVYRIVRIGKQYDTQVEIMSGIQVGEKIIVQGLEQVVDGGVIKGVNGNE